MPNNTNFTITHIHLKKEEESIQVYLVDNKAKTEERISVLPSEMHMPIRLSRAIIFVQTPRVGILLESELVDQAISSELDGVTSLLLNKQIHKFFDKGDEAFFKLNGKSIESGEVGVQQ